MPVLLPNVLDVLAPKPGESYLDLTAGYGGHARAVIEHTKQPERVTLVDRDLQALKSLGDLAKQGANLVHSDFVAAAKQLVEQQKQFDMILLDLGISSPHVDNPERGFSFNQDGPLDMRMDQSQELTAATVVNSYDEDRLASLLREYGEEPQARAIAKAIVGARPLETTSQLAEVVASVTRRQKRKIHPATRTFQAIRMAVNQELQQLEAILPLTEQLLAPHGRLAVISFHSLEDRIVKNFLVDRAKSGYESTMELITRRPILGTTESVSHPRSRSAVLRAAQLK